MRDCPTELLIGITNGEWPVYAFENDRHAISFLNDPTDGHRRRVWRVNLTVVNELEVLPPSEPRLIPKYDRLVEPTP